MSSEEECNGGGDRRRRLRKDEGDSYQVGNPLQYLTFVLFHITKIDMTVFRLNKWSK